MYTIHRNAVLQLQLSLDQNAARVVPQTRNKFPFYRCSELEWFNGAYFWRTKLFYMDFFYFAYSSFCLSLLVENIRFTQQNQLILWGQINMSPLTTSLLAETIVLRKFYFGLLGFVAGGGCLRRSKFFLNALTGVMWRKTGLNSTQVER